MINDARTLVLHMSIDGLLAVIVGEDRGTVKLGVADDGKIICISLTVEDARKVATWLNEVTTNIENKVYG